MTAIQDVYTRNDVTNTGLPVFQGFDFKVWTIEESSGVIAWLGDFASMTLSIRNATETILELGQMCPRYEDGEFQIAWVLEQHMQDMALLTRVFGAKNVDRNQYITSTPRFQITFDANAQINLADINKPVEFAAAISGRGPSGKGTVANATTKGRIELVRCKVDSLTQGFMAGRKAGQVRIEGVSEGFRVIPDQSVQEFKNATSTTGTRRNSIAAAGSGSNLNFTGISNTKIPLLDKPIGP